MMNGFWLLSDFYSGDTCEERVHQQRPPQPSTEHRERTAPRRRHDDVWCRAVNGFFCLLRVKTSHYSTRRSVPFWCFQYCITQAPLVYWFYNIKQIVVNCSQSPPLDLFFILDRSWPCPWIRRTVTSSQMLSLCSQWLVWTLNLKSGPKTSTGSLALVITTDQVRWNSLDWKYLNKPRAKQVCVCIYTYIYIHIYVYMYNFIFKLAF